MTESITYRLVVNTDKYAGNFERDMTAAATGVLGECEVGDSELDEFFEAAHAMGYEVEDTSFGPASPFEDLMEQRSDDTGCYRPCAMARVDDEYNAVEMYMYQRPAAKDMAFIVERVRSFAERNKITVKSIKFIKTVTKTVDEVLEEL